jgi:hypothetical protein
MVASPPRLSDAGNAPLPRCRPAAELCDEPSSGPQPSPLLTHPQQEQQDLEFDEFLFAHIRRTFPRDQRRRLVPPRTCHS